MAAAEREPGHAGRANDSSGNGQPKGMRRVIDIALCAAWLDPDRASGWIHSDASQAGEVDHQPIVTGPMSWAVVAASPDGNQEPLLAAEVHGGDNVRNIGATRDNSRTFVDHGVVKLAGLAVLGICGLENVAAKGTPEGHDGGLICHVSPFPVAGVISRSILMDPRHSGPYDRAAVFSAAASK
jgi:hypothetical protein